MVPELSLLMVRDGEGGRLVQPGCRDVYLTVSFDGESQLLRPSHF